jgi:hypothetical protein
MRRRTLLAGLGSLVASGSLAVGTGAFSTTRAERTVSVGVADDASAVLELKQRGSGGRSVETGSPEEITLSFPGAFASDDLGLGTDSVYEFDTDSGRDIFGNTNESEQEPGLLSIANRGTQPVSVFARDVTESAVDIELYNVADPDRVALREDPVTLTAGGSVNVGFRISTHGAASGNFDEELTVVARATA